MMPKWLPKWNPKWSPKFKLFSGNFKMTLKNRTQNGVKIAPKITSKTTVFSRRKRPRNHKKNEISSKWAPGSKMSPWDSKRPQNHASDHPKSRKNVGKRPEIKKIQELKWHGGGLCAQRTG